MTQFPVFFDTNVLYGSYVNDLILCLAERELFRPLWSEDILDELQKALLRNAPEGSHSSRIRRVEAMRTSFPDAIVTGYDPLLSAMTCHPKDCHVLAAAVRGDAAILVTFDLRDFPEDATSPYLIEVVHPDQFLLDQLDLYPRQTVSVIQQLLRDYENPSTDASRYLGRLTKSGLPDFAAELSRHLD